MKEKPKIPSPVICPACQAPDVRRSYQKGWWDAMMAHFGRPPLRCRRCTYRFYRKVRPGEKLGRPDVSLEKEPIW